MELTAKQRTALADICDTFGPGRADLPSASALGAVEIMTHLVAANPRAAEVKQFQQLLGLWNSPMGGLLLGIGPRRFGTLSAAEKEAALIALGDSKSARKRALFQALKGGAISSYYGAPGPTGHSPLWTAMDYPGPLGVRPDAPPPALTPQTFDADTELTCDVVVVGSGAGGGPAAAVLAEAGLEVIVLERGSYSDDRDFDGGELSGLARLYASGPMATTNGQISLVEGRGLGGGTVVNYTTCFRTPDHVRAQWAELGATQFADDEYAAAMDSVWERLSVNRDYGSISARDEIMEKGLTALGWHVDEMPRNVVGCDTGVECGRCGYGCRIGAKQSTAKTWLADAESRGARLVIGADVRKVLIERGAAAGVQARTASGHTVTVRARAVVVAAGALQTPALLKRSGLTNPNIGRNLRLHPATAVWATNDTPVRPWEGGMQTRYSTQHADLDGQGYGVIYETAATNPVLAALFMAWRGGAAHLDRMLGLSHLSGVGVITRDRDGGEVRVGRDGEPTVHYTLSARDAAHMRQGIDGGTRILEAAGATSIFTGHQAGATWTRSSGESIEGFLDRAHACGYDPGQCTMAALHIMGTARMGGSPQLSATNPDGATWEVANLVVADASSFPTSSGVNPMISVEAIGVMNARRLARSL